MSQQPVEIYPITVSKQPSSHSNESFGTVFVVLAVIVVVSAIACFLGRFCSRRQNHQKAKQNHQHNPQAKQNHVFREKEWEGKRNHEFYPGVGDIEFGFDPKRGSSGPKVAAKGKGKGSNKTFGNGEIRGEGRFVGGDELRAE